MPRYIDADALYEIFEREYKRTKGDTHSTFRECINYLCDAPTIDAVPVVRCGECIYAVWEKSEIKYCETWGAKCDCPYEIALTATDYCSYGAKMEDKL